MPTTRRDSCRLCGSIVLDAILDLGTLAVSDFPEPLPGVDPRILVSSLPVAPLDLRLCRRCGLVQLQHTVARDTLYRQYWYRSSINETMRAELADIVRVALLETAVHGGDPVVDVGANDGYLLSQYKAMGRSPMRIGVEPAENLQADCHRHCDILVADYFPPVHAEMTAHLLGRVKVLTSIAMFYDLEDPTAFVQAVDGILHDDGVWIVQFQDLAQMVEATAFDNVCHEHLTYWSLDTFTKLVERANVDLHVVGAERRAINGGSLRLLIRRPRYPREASVGRLEMDEATAVDWQALERFAWKTMAAASQIRQTVAAAQARGMVVDLYGASTKANTLLQYCGLGPKQIRQAWERSGEKFGRLTVTGIPIVDESIARATGNDWPDMLLVGIWQFRDAILAREGTYLEAGGRFLFPLPEVDLVSGVPPIPPELT